MPRAMWTGAISFGLVNVPVKMYTAARSKDIRFNQLRASDGTRIQMKRVSAVDGEDVTLDQIVKGYEVAPDKYVMITAEEMEALAPQVTQGIEIEEFVSLVDIDPVFFESSYYLAPGKGGARPYALLFEAMQEAGKIALGRVVLRQKQYLVALRPAGKALAMSTLYFPDEVVDPATIEDLPDVEIDHTSREFLMAQQLIEALTAEFEPGKYHDEFREKLMDLIERKASGEEIVEQPAAEEQPKVVDLMAALEASIAAAKKSRTAQSA